MRDHHPFNGRGHQWQLLIQLQSWRLEGRRPIVSHHGSNGQAIVCDDLCCLGRHFFGLPREISNPPDLLFERLLNMAVRFTHRLCHIFQIMILTNLMGYRGELTLHGSTDRFMGVHLSEWALNHALMRLDSEATACSTPPLAECGKQ